MSRTVTVRLGDDTHAQLLEAAAAMAVPVATLAAKLIGDGLRRPAVIPEDGPLVVAVREQFTSNGNGHRPDPVHQALAELLARQIESGASVNTERLMSLLRERIESAASWYDEEAREHEERMLSTPVWLTCLRCGGFMEDPGSWEGRRLLTDGETPLTYRELVLRRAQEEREYREREERWAREQGDERELQEREKQWAREQGNDR